LWTIWSCAYRRTSSTASRGYGVRSVAGSGIGLAVVGELVTAHAGTVTAESSRGSGTTVTIRLPLSRAGQSTSGAPPRTARDAAG
jgi:signal transduction histidine kinase